MKNLMRSAVLQLLRMAFIMVVALSLNIETISFPDQADVTAGINSSSPRSLHHPEDVRLESESSEEREADLQKKSELGEQLIVLPDLLVIRSPYVPANIDDIQLCLPITRVSTSVQSQAPPFA